MVTIGTADNALKSFYLDAVTEALNTKVNPFLAKIQKSTTDVVGKDVKKLVKVGMSGGIGAGSETGVLPTASASDYLQFTASLKNLYGTIEISDKAIRASANNEGAFVNLLNDEMQSLIKSATASFGRMLFGDGTGKLATVSEHLRGDCLTVDNIAPFEQGMIVDFYDSNGDKISEYSGVKIIAIDRAASLIRLSGGDIDTSTLDIGSTIYLQNSYNQEITGLEALFANTETLYGVDRENEVLRPFKKSVDGMITYEDIESAIGALEERWGGKINYIICSPGVKRAVMNMGRVNMMPFTTMEADGISAIDFQGVPIIADRFCPKGTMYFLNTDDFKLHQLCDWQWLEGEDGKILKQIPGKPVYTATLVKYAELLCEKPCAQGKITGILEF